MVKFQCKTDGPLSVDLILKDRKDLNPIKNLKHLWAVNRWQVGNVPPSQRGYKEFVYPVRIQERGGGFSFPPSRQVQFRKDLKELTKQSLENQKQALREYQEKTNYCQTLPPGRAGCKGEKVCETRPQCFQSSSGYQPQTPSLIMSVEYPNKKWYSVFDPRDLQNLNRLKCHSTGS